jgi:hypothetical protein
MVTHRVDLGRSKKMLADAGLTWNGATVGSATAGPAAENPTHAIPTTLPDSKPLNLIEFSPHRPSLVVSFGAVD